MYFLFHCLTPPGPKRTAAAQTVLRTTTPHKRQRSSRLDWPGGSHSPRTPQVVCPLFDQPNQPSALASGQYRWGVVSFPRHRVCLPADTERDSGGSSGETSGCGCVPLISLTLPSRTVDWRGAHHQPFLFSPEHGRVVGNVLLAHCHS